MLGSFAEPNLNVYVRNRLNLARRLRQNVRISWPKSRWRADGHNANSKLEGCFIQ